MLEKQGLILKVSKKNIFGVESKGRHMIFVELIHHSGNNIHTKSNVCYHKLCITTKIQIVFLKKTVNSRSSHCGAVEINPTRNREVAGSIPGLAQ